MNPRRQFDLRKLRTAPALIGVDEAGRGALAGPVVAAAVRVDRSFYDTVWCRRNSDQINDSKCLPQSLREELEHGILEQEEKGRVILAVESATVEEIERLNILGATTLAMLRALREVLETAGESIAQVGHAPLFDRDEDEPNQGSKVLIDGRPLKNFPHPHEGLVGGDGRSQVIAMASILAKVERDRRMEKLDHRWPGYGFRNHKGYGTEAHREAIVRQGPCRHHRASFLRKLTSSMSTSEKGFGELFG